MYFAMADGVQVGKTEAVINTFVHTFTICAECCVKYRSHFFLKVQYILEAMWLRKQLLSFWLNGPKITLLI